MREILNKYQVAMLQTLSECAETTRDALIKESRVPRHQFTLELPDLRERYLVDCVRSARGQAHKISISEAGIKALADHKAHQESLDREPEKAQPPRRNLFEYPQWQPPKFGYVRNDGHAQIKSRGMSV